MVPILVKSDDVRRGRKAKFVTGGYGRHRRQWVNTESFIDQACSVQDDWILALLFFASLWTLTQSWSINIQKKNLANIQPP